MAARKIIKKILLVAGLLVALVVAAAGAAGYYLTRPVSIDFAQNPNAVEAHEADRKLKLLSAAQTEQKQGFVRFSELEINSFLNEKYRDGKTAGEPVQLVKAGVVLGEGAITFITWHQVPVFGYNVPLVWQRVITPHTSTNGWSFTVESMKVGALDVPEGHWPNVEKLLGATDSLFEERKEWLQKLPMFTLAQNEQSNLPEVRLYTYLPQEKSKANETVSE